MKKTVLGVLIASFTVAPLVTGAATAEAKTYSVCKTGGDGRTGVCYYTPGVKRHVSVAEAVPLENHSSRKATLNCSFTRTISRSVDTGVSSTTEVKAGLFSVVDVSTNISVHRNVTQSGSAAVSAGGVIVLPPHTSVVCERTYGYVTATVVRKEWSGTRTWSKTYKAKVPVSLGVRIVD